MIWQSYILTSQKTGITKRVSPITIVQMHCDYLWVLEKSESTAFLSKTRFKLEEEQEDTEEE